MSTGTVFAALSLVAAGCLGMACSGGEPAATSAQGDRLSAQTAPGPAPLLINEVLANEPGTSPSGEMIELVNTTPIAIDLSGYTLSDGVSVRHTFQGTTLAAGCAIAVFGGAGSIPAGLGNAVPASTGSLGLNNGGDTVTFADATGAVLDRVREDRPTGSARCASWPATSRAATHSRTIRARASASFAR